MKNKERHQRVVEATLEELVQQFKPHLKRNKACFRCPLMLVLVLIAQKTVNLV